MNEPSTSMAAALGLPVGAPTDDPVPRRTILGGISVVGTTRTLRPSATAAYRASVPQQIDARAAKVAGSMALCTGSGSDRVAFALFPGIEAVRPVETDVSGALGVEVRTRRLAGEEVVARG